MRKRLLFSLGGVIFLYCWMIPQNNKIKKAEWLIGTWENKTQNGSIYETWTRKSNNELFGKSYLLNQKDTVVFETIRLVQEKDNLFYIPTVKNQNEGLPVRFTSKHISDTKLIFENRKHDFPQIISYFKITSDSLVAHISGVENEEEQKKTFPMKRVTKTF